MPADLSMYLQWVTLHGLIVMLGLAIYVTASHTLRQRRNPSAAIAWVIALVLLPYVALPLYIVFGNRKRMGRAQAPPLQHFTTPAVDKSSPPTSRSQQLATAMGLPC